MGDSMTILKRPVRREFKSPAWRRDIIIEIDPLGYIRLGEKRCRRRYSISIEALFYYLCRQEVQSKNQTRKRERTGRGAARVVVPQHNQQGKETGET